VAGTDVGATSLTIGGRRFDWGARTYVMGIINVTLDSFSGDGLGLDVEAAAAQGRRFAEEGADILDVGGESTRPGFQAVTPEEEMRRVLPVVERLAREVDVPVSVDTYKAAVARAALDAGAHLVNDIWGFRHDPAMAPLVAERGVPAVVMHNQRGRDFHDVIGDIRVGLEVSLGLAQQAGIPRQRLIIDPGFGFGWADEHNLEMLRRLKELRDLGLPILAGTSRKSTIGAVLGGVPAEERLMGTAATVAIAIAHGADIVRVHDVAEMVQVCRVADAVVRADLSGKQGDRR
jgi:dihydropteroate synthase